MRARNQAVSTSFLAHLLAITETRTIIDETVRPLPNTTAQIVAEPDCWRHYLGTGGQTVTVRPDLFVVVTGPDYQDHYFVEVDRDTENPARVISACHRYQAYCASGIEQQTGGVFPVTLWIVPHDRRQRQLQRYLDAESGLNPHLFAVITQQQLPEIITSGPPVTEQTEGDSL